MAVYVCSIAGALLFGILLGAIFGIWKFGEKPPVGTLKIRYGEPGEDPYMFLELWEGAGDVTKMDSVNLVVTVTSSVCLKSPDDEYS